MTTANNPVVTAKMIEAGRARLAELTNIILTQGELSAIYLAMTQASPDEMVERVARAMFEAWPMHAVSPALAETFGVEIGAPLTWDAVIEMGGNHDGLLRLARAALQSIGPMRGWDEVVEALTFYATEWEEPSDNAKRLGLACPAKVITHRHVCDYGERAKAALKSIGIEDQG